MTHAELTERDSAPGMGDDYRSGLCDAAWRFQDALDKLAPAPAPAIYQEAVCAICRTRFGWSGKLHGLIGLEVVCVKCRHPVKITTPRAMRADQFRARYERIEHPEAPKCEHGCNPAACPGCGTNLCLGGCGRNLGPYEECSCKGRP
jgi:hypothetical protein